MQDGINLSLKRGRHPLHFLREDHFRLVLISDYPQGAGSRQRGGHGAGGVGVVSEPLGEGAGGGQVSSGFLG